MIECRFTRCSWYYLCSNYGVFSSNGPYFCCICTLADAYSRRIRNIGSRTVPKEQHSERGNDELLKSYAAKDSDGDGLPDWQESLYGTDPNNAHSIDLTLTDSQAVAKGLVSPKFTSTTASSTAVYNAPVTAAPDSLTDSFAKTLFTNYVNSRGTTPATSAQLASFAQNAVQDMVSHNNQGLTYQVSDLHVSGNGQQAMLAYAASAQRIFDTQGIKTPKGKDDYISDMILNSDPVAAKELSKLSAAYIAIGKAMIALPAPAELATTHLEIANAMVHTGTALHEISMQASDPLQAYLGLSLYKQANAEYVKAFSDTFNALDSAQVKIPAGNVGSDFYMTAQKAHAAVTTPSTP
jgi:hypothetical protein